MTSLMQMAKTSRSHHAVWQCRPSLYRKCADKSDDRRCGRPALPCWVTSFWQNRSARWLCRSRASSNEYRSSYRSVSTVKFLLEHGFLDIIVGRRNAETDNIAAPDTRTAEEMKECSLKTDCETHKKPNRLLQWLKKSMEA